MPARLVTAVVVRAPTPSSSRIVRAESRSLRRVMALASFRETVIVLATGKPPISVSMRLAPPTGKAELLHQKIKGPLRGTRSELVDGGVAGAGRRSAVDQPDHVEHD